jgi:hypothetical protein
VAGLTIRAAPHARRSSPPVMVRANSRTRRPATLLLAGRPRHASPPAALAARSKV